MKKIKVIIKRPDEEYGHVTNISDSLKNLQKTVEGYIEVLPIGADTVIICNEEGRINGMPFNCALGGTMFYGPVVIVGIDGCEFTDAPDKEIYKNWREELAS